MRKLRSRENYNLLEIRDKRRGASLIPIPCPFPQNMNAERAQRKGNGLYLELCTPRAPVILILLLSSTP